MKNCEEKHSWPRWVSYFTVSSPGTLIVEQCNDCLTVRVKQLEYDRKGNVSNETITIVETRP